MTEPWAGYSLLTGTERSRVLGSSPDVPLLHQALQWEQAEGKLQVVSLITARLQQLGAAIAVPSTKKRR